MRAQSSMGFGKNIYKRKNSDKATWYASMEARVMPAHFEKTRGARIRGRFRSINAHDEQKRIKFRWIGHFAKVQEPHSGAHCQWGSAHPRGSTSCRSRSKSIRDCANTRENAIGPIGGKTLRRPRRLLWVGQRSKNHGWPKMGRQTMTFKTDNFVPLVVHGYPPILQAFRPLHHHRRTRQVHLQVQR